MRLRVARYGRLKACTPVHRNLVENKLYAVIPWTSIVGGRKLGSTARHNIEKTLVTRYSSGRLRNFMSRCCLDQAG